MVKHIHYCVFLFPVVVIMAAQYCGMSLRDVYLQRCLETGCKQNSLLLRQLPETPDRFDMLLALDLSSNFVGPKGLLPVLEVVRACTSIRTLDLRDQHLANETVEKLCNALQTHPSLTMLNLSHNPITMAGGRCLLDLVKTNAVLESVILEGTDIRPVLTNAISVQLSRNRLNKESRGEVATRNAELLAAVAAEGHVQHAATLAYMDVAVARSALESFPYSLAPTLLDECAIEAVTSLCHKYDARFYDPQFPPASSSIQRIESASHPLVAREWRRLGEVAMTLPGVTSVAIFPSLEASMDAAAQTELSQQVSAANFTVRAGYRWLFSCIQAHALDSSAPHAINLRAMISPAFVNPYGVYSVRVYIDGKWRFVLVDDTVPVLGDGKPAFAYPLVTDGVAHLWPCIFEKAMAKLHGCYQALDRTVISGPRHPSDRPSSCSRTLADISGGVGMSRDLHHGQFDPDEWFGHMLEYLAKRAVLVTSSIVQDSVVTEHLGITPNEVYRLLAARQVNGFRLVRLQCSYSARTWVGDWSPKSPMWQQYPEVDAALRGSYAASAASSTVDPCAPHAAFWMPYIKFLQCFNSVHVCRTLSVNTTVVLEGHWDRNSAGGPFFEPTWYRNPHYRLIMPMRSQVLVHLALPDDRFSPQEDVSTIGLHVIQSQTYPLRLEKDDVVARTSYVISNSVCLDSEVEPAVEGSALWIVPSAYTPNRMSRYFLRVSSDVPFTVSHEALTTYWKQHSFNTRVEKSGEYQNGEDNVQYAITLPPANIPTRFFAQMHTPEKDQCSLALFLCDGSTAMKTARGETTEDPSRVVAPKQQQRLLGPVPEREILGKSRFVISNCVHLEANVPSGAAAGGSHLVLLTCVYPEQTTTPLRINVFSSQPKFVVSELPFWKQQRIATRWTRSGGFQEVARNPQIEVTGVLPNQTLLIRCQAVGAVDPSIIFFVVKNSGRVGEALPLKRIDDDDVHCKSIFIRHHTATRELVVGPKPCDSYIIVPCLQPAGSQGECVITVSSIFETFVVRDLTPVELALKS